MEKGVLLVLLCLSFLLITAFTAADAAALVEENQQHRQKRLCPYLIPCLVPPVRPQTWLGWTATDAATLVKENRKQVPSLCIYLGPCPATTVNPNFGLGCLKRPGGCDIFAKTTVQPELSKQHKIKEIKSVLQ
ncbi:uncharacterized protein AB9X84_002030 isoform 2-T2 [Acanthopagrus schlegelii]